MYQGHKHAGNELMNAARVSLMVVLLIVLNAAVSPSAHADTYLCIGEHYTSVTYPRPLKHHKAQSGSKTGGGEGVGLR
jgi:hypothetical protein